MPTLILRVVAIKLPVDTKEGKGGSDLNVQLTLSGDEMNMSTAPDMWGIINQSINQSINRQLEQSINGKKSYMIWVVK